MHVHSKRNRTVQMILKNKVIYMFKKKKKVNGENSEVKCTDLRFTAVEKVFFSMSEFFVAQACPVLL